MKNTNPMVLLLLCGAMFFSCTDKDKHESDPTEEVVEEEFQCPTPLSRAPLTETIYLNLDLRAPWKGNWQLCHAELEDTLKPFVLLSKVNGKQVGKNYRIDSMRFRAEPFFGKLAAFKVINVKKRSDTPRSVDNYNMYDIEVTVGLVKEKVVENKLKDMMVDTGTAFDYHVTMTPDLEDFLRCNVLFSANPKLFGDYQSEGVLVAADDICCGAICASRFVY